MNSIILHIKFWEVEEKQGNPALKIQHTGFSNLLNAYGFKIFDHGNRKSVVLIENNIIKRVSSVDIIQKVKLHIEQMPADFESGFTKLNLIEELFEKVGALISTNRLYLLQVNETSMKFDTQFESFLYYKNCYVKITKEGLTTYPYSQLDALIWESQIIKREFTPIEMIGEDVSVFSQFIKNCMGNDNNRFLSLKSALGYLIHKYKDPKKTVAVILCDEVISDEPNGGTGKSLTVRGLKELCKLAVEDGKNFSFNGSFRFQQVDFDTDIILFEDTKKKFDFEKLFSVITDGINVEKKYQSKIHFSFENTPKILITTNYVIMGRGNSFTRRMVEFEFSQHYNENNTPLKEFGHTLFSDWSKDEWQLFDNFMANCVKLYLENGIVIPPKINLNQRKLIQETCPEFIDFIKELDLSKEHDKQTVFRNFIYCNKHYEHKLHQNTFTNWLKSYEYYTEGVEYSDRRSNSKSYFRLAKKGESIVEIKEEVSVNNIQALPTPVYIPPSALNWDFINSLKKKKD